MALYAIRRVEWYTARIHVMPPLKKRALCLFGPLFQNVCRFPDDYPGSGAIFLLPHQFISGNDSLLSGCVHPENRFAVANRKRNLVQTGTVKINRIQPEVGTIAVQNNFRFAAMDQKRKVAPLFPDPHFRIAECHPGAFRLGQVENQQTSALRQREIFIGGDQNSAERPFVADLRKTTAEGLSGFQQEPFTPGRDRAELIGIHPQGQFARRTDERSGFGGIAVFRERPRFFERFKSVQMIRRTDHGDMQRQVLSDGIGGNRRHRA